MSSVSLIVALALSLTAPVATAAANLAVSPTSAPAGSVVTVKGTGYPRLCGMQILTSIRLLWDGGDEIAVVKQIASDGSFSTTARIPADAKAGPHIIQSDCSASVADATPPLSLSSVPVLELGYASSSLSVRGVKIITTPRLPRPRPRPTGDKTVQPTKNEPKKPTKVLGLHITRPASQQPPVTIPPAKTENPTATHQISYRSSVPGALRVPSKSAGKLGAIGLSLAVASALVLLLGFPSELFNATLEDNYAEISGWLAGVSARTAPLRGAIARLSPRVGVIVFGLASGVMLSFLDPTLGLNKASLAFILGLVGAVFVITCAAELTQMAWVYRHGRHGYLKTFPPATLLAGMCVAMSRLLHFAPGYAFGLTAGYTPHDELDTRETGITTTIGALSVLFLSIAAWFVWGPINAAASKQSAGFGLLFVDSLFAGIVLCGFGGLVFTLLPLRYCDGAKIKAWSKKLWIAIFGASVFWFVHVIATPQGSGTGSVSSIVKAVTLFLVFGLASVAFWAYFRFRKSHDTTIVLDPEPARPLREEASVGIGSHRDFSA